MVYERVEADADEPSVVVAVFVVVDGVSACGAADGVGSDVDGAAHGFEVAVAVWAWDWEDFVGFVVAEGVSDLVVELGYFFEVVGVDEGDELFEAWF